MTLAQLSAAWQSLRNALLGRSGMDAKASAELIARFNRSYERFREWYEQAGPGDDLLGSVGGASEHVEELRAITEAAAREGVQAEVKLPTTALETLSTVGNVVAGMVFAIAGAATLIALFGRGRKG